MVDKRHSSEEKTDAILRAWSSMPTCVSYIRVGEPT